MQRTFPRGFRSGDALAILAVVVALVVTFRAHTFFIWPEAVQLGADEGYEAAVVERMLDHRLLPYADGLSHRGPFLYWTAAVFELICGRFEWAGTRWLALAAALTTTSATFLAGWAAGWPLAGAVAALVNVFITCAVLPPGVGLGVHSEPIAVAYLTLALFAAAYALHREPDARWRTAQLLLSGVLTAICALTKQPLVLAGVPLFLWVLLHEGAAIPPGVAPSKYRPVWLRHGIVPFCAGGSGLVLLVLARYVVAGEFKTLLFWSTGFNAKNYLAPYKGVVIDTLTEGFWGSGWIMAGTVLCLLVMSRPLALIEGRSWTQMRDGFRGGSFEFVVAGMGLALLTAGALGMRFWPHYFFPVHPYVGLSFGVLVESLLRREQRVPVLAQVAALGIATTMAVKHPEQRLTQLRAERATGAWHSHRPDPACAEIDRIAGAGREAVFVWGMAGDLYITCQRRSASMFTYTTVIAGIIPPFSDPNPNYVAPGSRATLLAELTNGRPPVLIDAPMGPRAGMMDVSELAKFVHANYCHVSRLTDKRQRELTFYARKDLAACKH